MDCTLDQELIDEGLAREMVNRIQQARKTAKLNVSDRVSITIVLDGPESAKLEQVINQHKVHIQNETLGTSITVGSMQHQEPLLNGLPILDTAFRVGLKKG
jgi:isoleucyl-tRNA synthetase